MKNDIIKILKSNLFFKIVFSLILGFFTLCTFLFCDNSKIKNLLEVEIEKENNDKPIYVSDISINDNQYLMSDYIKTDEESTKVELTTTNFSFEYTANDDINIELEEENIKSITLSINGEEHDFTLDDDNYIYTINNSSMGILVNLLSNSNIFNDLIIISIFSFLIFLLINVIYYFIDSLFIKKFNLILFLLAIVSLFIICYLTFYSIVSINELTILLPLFIVLFAIFKKYKNFNLEKVYVVLALFIGMTVLFAVPAFNISDEDNHFVKVYDHAFYIEKANSFIADGNKYTYLSENMDSMRTKYSFNRLNGIYKYNVMNFFEDYTTDVDRNNMSNNAILPSTNNLKNFAYIPANIFVSLAKKTNMSTLFTFLVGRFANLIFFIFLGYVSLSIIPKFKPGLFIALTYTLTFHQACSIGQDPMNMALIFLTFAYIMKMIFQKERIDKKQYLVVSLLIIGLSLCKLIYTPMILLLLAIDNNKISDSKSKALLIKFGLVGAAALLTVGWYISPSLFTRNVPSNTDVAVKYNYYTVHYFIENPVSFAKIYVRTIIQRFSLDVFRGYFDGFGWSTVWNPDLILYILTIIYSIVIATIPKGKISSKENYKLKFICLFTFVSISMLITFSMLFGWTHIGDGEIDGLQPRYFLPLIPLLYVAINNNLIKLNVKNYNKFLTYIIIVANLLCCATILYRFYM